MLKYIVKAVGWNSNNFTRPAGDESFGGFKKKNGFGFEEWNNRNGFIYDGNRLFYLVPEEELYDSDLLIFIIASNNNNQYLLGVAGNARFLTDSEDDQQIIDSAIEDIRITSDGKSYRLYNLWKEAWKIRKVKNTFKSTKIFVNKFWKEEFRSIVSVICDEDLYLWLKKPILLDANAIVNKEKFTNRHGKHQNIDQNQARNILNKIPVLERGKIFDYLSILIDSDMKNAVEIETIQEDKDIDIIKDRFKNSPTTARRFIEARRGQGKFRLNVMKKWSNKCALTSVSSGPVLRASHIKPWNRSDDKERLDPDNGLILSAHIDALFDAGLITFDRSGLMKISSLISIIDRQILNLPTKLVKPLNKNQIGYLKYHNKILFKA